MAYWEICIGLCEMSLDITWCTGLRCDRKEWCHRYIENLKRLVKKRGMDFNELQISVATFADHDGKCDDFMKLKQEI